MNEKQKEMLRKLASLAGLILLIIAVMNISLP